MTQVLNFKSSSFKDKRASNDSFQKGKALIEPFAVCSHTVKLLTHLLDVIIHKQNVLFVSPVVDPVWGVFRMPQHNKLWAVCQLQARPAEPRVPETSVPETQMCMSHPQGKLAGTQQVFFFVWLLLRCFYRHPCLFHQGPGTGNFLQQRHSSDFAETFDDTSMSYQVRKACTNH